MYVICGIVGFPGGTSGKSLPASSGAVRDAGLIPGLERSPGKGHGNSLQYSCLGNVMDRGAGGLWSVGSQKVGHD